MIDARAPRLILSCMAGLVVIGLAAARAAEAPPQQEPPKNAIALAAEARNALRALPDFERIGVIVENGIVTLTGKVIDPMTIESAKAAVTKVPGIVAVRSEMELDTDVSARVIPVFERMIQRAKALVVQLPAILAGLMIFLLFYFAASWLGRSRALWQRLHPNPLLAAVVANIVRLATILFGLVIGLEIVGAMGMLSTIIGAAGIMGLAVSFAVKDTIENYLGGIMLSLRQPFLPNDHVRIGDREGMVLGLTSFSTLLVTPDGNHLRIPNAEVFKATILNFSQAPKRRFEFVISRPESNDAQQLLRRGIDAIQRVKGVLPDPPCSGVIVELTQEKVTLQFRGWINASRQSMEAIRTRAILSVDAEFRDSGRPVEQDFGMRGPDHAEIRKQVTRERQQNKGEDLFDPPRPKA